jgi:hypothetical protein
MANIYIQMYKGEEIEKSIHNGFYVCFMSNKGYLKADTLKGIKLLINENLRRC